MHRARSSNRSSVVSLLKAIVVFTAVATTFAHDAGPVQAAKKNPCTTGHLLAFAGTTRVVSDRDGGVWGCVPRARAFLLASAAADESSGLIAVAGRFVALEVAEGAAFQKCTTLTVRVVDVVRRSVRAFSAGTAAGAPSEHGCVNSGHPVIERAVRRDGAAAIMVKEASVGDPGSTAAYEVLRVTGRRLVSLERSPDICPGSLALTPNSITWATECTVRRADAPASGR